MRNRATQRGNWRCAKAEDDDGAEHGPKVQLNGIDCDSTRDGNRTFVRTGIEGSKPVLRIGVISDTHGLLRPQVEQRLAGVAHIVHGGDIGRPDVIAGLRRISPVTAIRGNIDTGEWAEHYPDTQVVRLGGRTIYVLHDINELQLDPVSSGVDVVVSGHSHVPRIETINGVLYLNPGSAGPRRFNLPVTVATLELTASGFRPSIHHLCVKERWV